MNAFHFSCLVGIALSIVPEASAAPASSVIRFDRPAQQWENGGLPIGNGSLGGVLMGEPSRAVLQFNVDSLWTGDENPSGNYSATEASPGAGCFGAFQNFGELVFEGTSSPATTVSSGSRSGTDFVKQATPSTSSEEVPMSIDGDPKTKWCFQHKNAHVTWQASLAEPATLSTYSFTSASDVPARDPENWVLEGSNDNTRWTTIDKRLKIAPIDQRGKTVTYSLKKPASFRHFRFTFVPRKKTDHFQVAEIALGGIDLKARTNAPDNYTRQLDIANSLHTTSWQDDGVTYTREALASHPDQVIAWRFTASKPGSINGTLRFKGAHPDGESIDTANPRTLRLKGTLANDLRYEARAQVVPVGGKVTTGKDSLQLQNCNELVILLAADTNYVMDLGRKWMSGDPADRIVPRLAKASTRSWKEILTAHQGDYRKLFDRVAIDLGKSDGTVAALPINERIGRYREQARDLPRPCLDPELESLLFQYGRYLLISCSRPGTLPANLQGLWNNSNKPAWSSDYHTNINLQMCYWLAESSNLSELADPLFDMLTSGAPVYRKFTALEYGADTKGYVTRMSLNPFGGGGWNWNIEGTAWLSQHYWEHYRFSMDEAFLRDQAWPWMRDVSLFWLGRLKKLPDGTLVVPNAWSHEHGPHEDGTAHAQQLMFDLFTSTREAARILGIDPSLQARLTSTLEKLHGPEVGSWGQLMEWMGEKPDLEKGNHRHTSHLFAVHPGEQISLARTPELAEAARVSLTKRGEVGDSRRSWTWAWRTALWARLGDPERAHGCVAGLLAHNTLDNLWATHPPFQIDGNMGITAGMIELFLQSHGGEIALLPALPAAYPTGSIRGLRARGEIIVDLRWQDGKLVEATLKSPIAQSVALRLPGAETTRAVDLPANQAVAIDFQD